MMNFSRFGLFSLFTDKCSSLKMNRIKGSAKKFKAANSVINA